MCAGGGARPSDADAAELYTCLRTIFERAPDFGGGLFALAASVVTDLIHHDPLVYRCGAGPLPRSRGRA